MSDTFHISPKTAHYPFLVAGEYGPGRSFEADCEIKNFQIPCDSDNMPLFDPDGERGPYAYFEIDVRSEDRGFVKIRHYEPIGENSGSRVLPWLNDLGLATDDGEIMVSQVPGTKCVVEVLDPRPDKRNPDKWYTGRLRALEAV